MSMTTIILKPGRWVFLIVMRIACPTWRFLPTRKLFHPTELKCVRPSVSSPYAQVATEPLAVRRIPAEPSSSGLIPQLSDRLFGNFWIRKTYQLISSLTHFTLSKDSTTFLLSMNSTNKYIWIIYTINSSLDSTLISMWSNSTLKHIID